MIKFFGFSLILLLSNYKVCSQVSFVKGYVITNNKDTVWGEIDYKDDLKLRERCDFRKSTESMVVSYSPTDIIGYGLNDIKFFLSKEITIDGKVINAFLEFVANGELDIFCYRERSNAECLFFIEKEDKELISLPYADEIRYVNDKAYLVPSSRHISILDLYTNDVKGLSTKIYKIKKPTYKNMISIAKTYHDLASNGDKFVVYTKRKSAGYEVEYLSGLVFSNEDSKSIYISNGIQTYLRAPKLNENLTVKLGIIHLLHQRERLIDDFYSVPNNTYMIPVILEYRFNKYDVKPTIGAGITLGTLGALSLHTGVKYAIHNRWILSLNGSTWSYFPSQISAYGGNLGVSYKIIY